MGNLMNQLLKVRNKASLTLNDLIVRHHTQSEFSNTEVIKITDEDFNYNLDDGRWLKEISQSNLIDNEGHTCDHDCITHEQLFELIDHLAEKLEGEQRTIEILQHEIGFWIKDEDGNLRTEELPEADTDHIESKITDGVYTGELCCYIFVEDEEKEPLNCHGWWKIL